ncbi:hypothetical protein DL240_09030 [Lujinxingia litoralis]|uniref:Uncharacterized protein n=1 Tax=Lujinxingia litoralis TaxID=2211119 RepID=A0A328C5Z7_9DELT|nr:hypothetical protein [Lujinxingia litoralis]RAL23021.1 hypothetical protein DL240_09030 [Lujinxingia litoralis]
MTQVSKGSAGGGLALGIVALMVLANLFWSPSSKDTTVECTRGHCQVYTGKKDKKAYASFHLRDVRKVRVSSARSSRRGRSWRSTRSSYYEVSVGFHSGDTMRKTVTPRISKEEAERVKEQIDYALMAYRG